MKSICPLIIFLLTCSLIKAQSKREDIVINWPKTDQWELDKRSLIQTDFAHRHQKWGIKNEQKENWQKIALIFDDDKTETMMSLDSINSLIGVSKTVPYVILKENKNAPFPYKLIGMENRKIKSEQTPISQLAYITDGATCRHIILISIKGPKLSEDFIKQWSEILLNSRIVPSKDGNFEKTDDAYVDLKEANNDSNFYVTASFTSRQVRHLLKGQSAKIVIDDFPELNLSGEITEISDQPKGSFLTSPNNNSGNFIKVLERFSVKIKVKTLAALSTKIKNNMSCVVTVATGQ